MKEDLEVSCLMRMVIDLAILQPSTTSTPSWTVQLLTRKWCGCLDSGTLTPSLWRLPRPSTTPDSCLGMWRFLESCLMLLLITRMRECEYASAALEFCSFHVLTILMCRIREYGKRSSFKQYLISSGKKSNVTLCEFLRLQNYRLGHLFSCLKLRFICSSYLR